jgi:hypothetical protein
MFSYVQPGSWLLNPFLRNPFFMIPDVVHMAFFEFSQEDSVLVDFGKKLILGLVAAACVVGAHAAMVSAVVG